MGKPKHLPVEEWPKADIAAFAKVYKPGDIFDETASPGAHLRGGTRKMITTAYRRWLGFLTDHDPEALLVPPADRITLDRVRSFVHHLEKETRSTSVAIVIDNLCYAARLIASERDWLWLASIKRRLRAQAKPIDRFNQLVPPVLSLDFGIALMDEAMDLPESGHREREIQYRDGLILAVLVLLLPRRRSIALLTVSRHLEFDADGINILLFPEDIKSKRAESFRVPDQLLPYFQRYLREIRPRLLGRSDHDGLWASYRGRPLCEARIYNMVRRRIKKKFGQDMGLHDFRRAGATFLAMDAPEKISLIPAMLQHSSPEIGERHYNLARSIEASRRFGAHLAKTKSRLRPALVRTKE
jgi:integrase/recombinase XerD